MSSNDFVTGAVKWFDPGKGYGFIVCEGKDIFLHSKRLRDSGFELSNPSKPLKLEPGDKLKFRIESGPKGAFATEISKG